MKIQEEMIIVLQMNKRQLNKLNNNKQQKRYITIDLNSQNIDLITQLVISKMKIIIKQQVFLQLEMMML